MTPVEVCKGWARRPSVVVAVPRRGDRFTTVTINDEILSSIAGFASLARIVSCHLGAGASVCAVLGGRSGGRRSIRRC